MKLQGPKPQTGRILIRLGPIWDHTEWNEIKTIGRRVYIKDPVLSAWIEIRRLRFNEPDGPDPLANFDYKEPSFVDPIFIGPRGGRYRINSSGRKSYDVS